MFFKRRPEIKKFWPAVGLTAAVISAQPLWGQNCEKLMGPEHLSWKSVPCERLKQSYLRPLRELPELKDLSAKPLEEAIQLMGLPFHLYTYQGRTVCFFRPEASLIIAYDEKTEMPAAISFDFTGVLKPEEIPEALGLASDLPAQTGSEGLIWENPAPFVRLEVKNSDLRIDGEKVYQVSLDVPPAPRPLKKEEGQPAQSKPARRKR